MMFFILKKSNFLHYLLLGDSPFPRYWDNYPCTKLPKHLDDFFIIKFSYYSYELITASLFNRKRKDFSELILHHIVTLSLVICALLTNQMAPGAVVMMILDFTDIFINVMKILLEVGTFVQQLFWSFVMKTVWIYMRIYFYGRWILYVYYHEIQGFDHKV